MEVLSERKGKAVWTRRRIEGVDGAPDFRDLWEAVFEGCEKILRAWALGSDCLGCPESLAERWSG